MLYRAVQKDGKWLYDAGVESFFYDEFKDGKYFLEDQIVEPPPYVEILVEITDERWLAGIQDVVIRKNEPRQSMVEQATDEIREIWSEKRSMDWHVGNLQEAAEDAVERYMNDSTRAERWTKAITDTASNADRYARKPETEAAEDIPF
jgi:hypothetical protein